MYAIQKKEFVFVDKLLFNQILRFAQNDRAYLLCSMAAWAAARRAIGTRKGEQET